MTNDKSKYKKKLEVFIHIYVCKKPMHDLKKKSIYGSY